MCQYVSVVHLWLKTVRVLMVESDLAGWLLLLCVH
jgi:hypothetical protein